MNRFMRRLILLGSTALLVIGTNLSAIASQLWSGTGQIISGPGQGGVVKALKVSVSPDREQVTFQSGSPSRGKTIPLSNGSGRDGELQYEFTWQADALQVTFQASDQVILYTLRQNNLSKN